MPESKIYFHRRRPSFGAGIPVFSVMRDEDYFLPHFLEHYRRLGAGHFLIYADRCTERFMAALESQDDVSILLSNDVSFGTEVGVQKTGLPKRWATFLRERASNRLYAGKWHLIVDSDEFMILPPGFGKLAEFTGFLDSKGRNYAYAPMVDFHPRRLALRNHAADLPPFAVSHFFDAGPYHSLTPRGSLSEARHKGVRRRIATHLQKHFPEDMETIYGKNPVMNLMAMTHKFPLLKTGASQKREGDHFISNVDRLNHGCALAEGQYFRGSLKYKFIDLAIRKLDEFDLVCNSSVRYREPSDMVAARLIDTSD
jgi:hypothetical protein